MEETTEECREIAAATMLGDLMHCVVDMAKALPAPWQQLGEQAQRDWLESIEKRCTDAAHRCVDVLAGHGRTAVRATLKGVNFNAAGVAATLVIDRTSEHRIELADAAGQLVHLVMANTDIGSTTQGKPKPEPDQRDLGLPGDAAEPEFDDGPDPMYQEAVTFVRTSRRCNISALQRNLRIGYNRAARLLERMEAEKILTPMDESGRRSVLLEQPASDTETEVEQLAAAEEQAAGALGHE